MMTGLENMTEEEFFFEYGGWEYEKFLEEVHRYTVEHGVMPYGAKRWAMPMLAKLKECISIDAKKPSEEG